MNVLLTLTHPNPASFNAAIAQRIDDTLTEAGHDVRRNNLYEKGFGETLGMADFERWGEGAVPDDVKAEQADVEWADALAFVYPIWWNERPAKLKGWCDRVLTRPWAWDLGAEGLVSKLTDKRGFVAVTHGSPEALYRQLGTDLATLNQPMLNGTLAFCGITDVEWHEEFGVLMQDRAANEAYLERVAASAKTFFA